MTETTTTNASGQYSFTGLNPSNGSGYSVSETVPGGYTHEGQTSTTPGAVTTPLTTPLVSNIVLTTNGASSTDNFAETAVVAIDGNDYLVPNTTTPASLTTSTTGNPIAGTTVALSGTDIFGNPVSATTTTAADGSYSFTDLNPSNASGYTVTETPPASDSHVGQTLTTTGAVTNTPPGTPSVVSNIVVNPGGTSTDNYFETQTVSVNGVDFVDANSDLIQQGNEAGIPGTTVTLTGKDAFGDTISDTTTTNASGAYSFTGLNPSNGSGYTVTETVPSGYTHEGQTSTTPGAVTTPSSTPLVSNIVLTTNGATSTDDFAEEAFDLAITKTDGTTTYTPGSSTTYTIVVSNNGPSNVTGAAVNDLLQSPITSATWSAVASAGASVATSSGTGSITNDLVSLIPGATVTFTLVAQTSPSATGNLANTSTVSTTATSPAGVTDSNSANNTATDIDTPTVQADLAITKTDGVTSVVPGTNDTYVITVTSNGPSTVTGATVSDVLPAGETFVSATGGATYNSSTNTVSYTAGTLATGGTTSFNLTVAISPTATGSISNTATVAPPSGVTDTNPSNNSSTDTDTLTPQADLAIVKTDGVTRVVPGTNDTYTITVSSNGPSTVTGATVSDVLPAGETFVSATGGATYNSGTNTVSYTTGTLATGGTTSFNLTVAISPTATGSISNTATVAPPSGVTDTNPSNNSSTDTDTLTPQADLAIAKTDGVTSVVPGTNDTYTITVTSNGPSTVTGATVSDVLPAGETFVSATGGATYNSSTNTVSYTAGTLATGGTTSFNLTVAISPSATGSISNTATVAPPSGVTDTNPSNNSSTDTDTLTPQFDLAISKTANSTTYTQGGNTTYTLVASDNGPSSVSGAAVNDSLPSAITSATWTAVASAGASVVTSSGTGSIVNDNVSLVPGATVTFTLVAQISSSATGNLVNTATVATTATSPAGVTDSNTSNNTSSWTETPSLTPNVTVTKTADNANLTLPEGGIIEVGYVVTITNSGTSAATGVTLSDPLPSGSYNDVTWTIDSTDNTGNFVPGDFTIAGSKPSQNLTLASTFNGNLAVNPSIAVHITGVATANDTNTSVNPALNVGGAAGYAVLYEGTGGHNFSITNDTIDGNIGVDGTGQVKYSGPGAVNGRLDFKAASSGQYGNSNSSNVGPTSVNYSVGGVDTAMQAVNTLGANLATLPTQTNLIITFPSNNAQTINESSGGLDTSNGVTYRVFDINNSNNYKAANADALTINGDGSGDPVVINFTYDSNTNLGGSVVLAGGLTADQVIWNFVSTNNGQPDSKNISLTNNGETYQGVIIAPIDTISLDNTNLYGRVYGGGSNDLQIVSGANVYAPVTTGTLVNTATVGATGDSGKPGQSATATITLSSNPPVASTGAAVAKGQFATLGFWGNKNGQSVINSFNGSSTATQLGNWMASNFPNLFGSANSYIGSSLAGKTNAQIATIFSNLGTGGVQANTYIQAFSVALGIYADTSSLGGNATAQSFGFTVSSAGGAAATFNVGNNGAAFGVANNINLSIYTYLMILDGYFCPTNSLFYGGNSTLTSDANNITNGINQGGDI